MSPTHQAATSELLLTGDLKVSGRLVDASNTTLLAEIENGDTRIQCVYKPTAGERPLWDFPSATLANRETATFLLADLSGLTFVPPTVLRPDGPHGGGMVQMWLPDADYESLVRVTETDDSHDGYLPVIHAHDSRGIEVVVEHLDDEHMQDICLFDLVVNNADRKGGHLFISQGALYGVDHGLTWHSEPKLRTVLWGWAGAPFSDRNIDVLTSIEDSLSNAQAFEGLVSKDELLAARIRVKQMQAAGRFPSPQPDEPNIPWPVF